MNCRLYGVRCGGCNQTILSNELVMRAMGNVYHVTCFVCVVCRHQLQKGDQFVANESEIYCRLDFEKKFANFIQLSPKSSDWFHTKCTTSQINHFSVSPQKNSFDLSFFHSFLHQLRVVSYMSIYIAPLRRLSEASSAWQGGKDVWRQREEMKGAPVIKTLLRMVGGRLFHNEGPTIAKALRQSHSLRD